MLTVCLVAVVASAVVGGVFLTFSDFMMSTLRNTSSKAAIDVMQEINRQVFPTIFMVLLLGMSVLSVGLLGFGLATESAPGTTWMATAGGLFFVGVFVVTLLGNVPMNTRLAKQDSANTATRTYWLDTYVPRWTFWNSVRTGASIATSACYLLACLAILDAP